MSSPKTSDDHSSSGLIENTTTTLQTSKTLPSMEIIDQESKFTQASAQSSQHLMREAEIQQLSKPTNSLNIQNTTHKKVGSEFDEANAGSKEESHIQIADSMSPQIQIHKVNQSIQETIKEKDEEIERLQHQLNLKQTKVGELEFKLALINAEWDEKLLVANERIRTIELQLKDVKKKE